MHERRRNTRVAAQFSIRVAASRKVVRLTTWNLSMRGLECPTEPHFKLGRSCQIRFDLSPGIRFSVTGRFVRIEQGQAGIFFTSLDENAYYHLRRAVQYNAPDADRIDAELAATARCEKKKPAAGKP